MDDHEQAILSQTGREVLDSDGSGVSGCVDSGWHELRVDVRPDYFEDLGRCAGGFLADGDRGTAEQRSGNSPLLSLTIVGIQANLRIGTKPLVGSKSWNRLQLLGAPEHATLRNLFEPNETVSMVGIEDRVRSCIVEAESRGDARVVFLGRIAKLGFTRALRRDVGWFDWVLGGMSPTWVAVHPHPSGKSKWFNDDQRVREAQEFWEELRVRT